jgi:glycosyltransferase involved in cell wall biosynthesis
MISGEKQPLVSFIVPYFNAGSTIQEAIDSIFNQDYSNFDVWIINDGTTDEQSVEKLKDFEGNPQIKVLHQQNAGPSVARNNAIKQSTAEFFVPLDADNKICSNALSESVNEILKSEGIGAVYGNFIYFGNRSGLKKQSAFSIRKALIYNQVDTCALISRKLFDSGIFYNEHLSKLGLEDWEFWISVYSKSYQMVYVDMDFFEMRVSDTSRTFQVANKNLTQIKEYVYKKHIDIFSDEYQELFYDFKMIKETPDYRIGNFLLKPFRLIKNNLKIK